MGFLRFGKIKTLKNGHMYKGALDYFSREMKLWSPRQFLAASVLRKEVSHTYHSSYAKGFQTKNWYGD